MGYIVFLLLFYNFIGLIFSALALFFSTKILLNKTFTKNLSISLIVYFLYVSVYGIFACPYYTYIIAFWRPDTVILDAKLLYFFGIFPFIFISLNALFEFFICIDRCFAVIFGLGFTKSHQRFILFLSILSNLGFSYIYFSNLVLYFPDGSQTECRFFACFIKDTSTILLIKGISAISSFFASLTLMALLKYKISTTNNYTKKINKTIIITIIITTFLELIPYIFAQIYLTITGQSLVTVAGPYVSIISSINVAVTTGIYFNTFKKVNKIIISTNNNNNNNQMFIKNSHATPMQQ